MVFDTSKAPARCIFARREYGNWVCWASSWPVDVDSIWCCMQLVRFLGRIWAGGVHHRTGATASREGDTVFESLMDFTHTYEQTYTWYFLGWWWILLLYQHYCMTVYPLIILSTNLAAPKSIIPLLSILYELAEMQMVAWPWTEIQSRVCSQWSQSNVGKRWSRSRILFPFGDMKVTSLVICIHSLYKGSSNINTFRIAATNRLTY